MYGNEEKVGKSLITTGLKREDVFITTKLWLDDFRRDNVEKRSLTIRQSWFRLFGFTFNTLTRYK
ncbi:hypothetical protein FH128_03335 [Staphylococcus hominis]|nr:hypothetical protein [Staphylococcus hominis]